MPYLTEADVVAPVTMDDAIAALDGAFRQWGRENPLPSRTADRIPVRMKRSNFTELCHVHP